MLIQLVVIHDVAHSSPSLFFFLFSLCRSFKDIFDRVGERKILKFLVIIYVVVRLITCLTNTHSISRAAI